MNSVYLLRAFGPPDRMLRVLAKQSCELLNISLLSRALGHPLRQTLRRALGLTPTQVNDANDDHQPVQEDDDHQGAEDRRGPRSGR